MRHALILPVPLLATFGQKVPLERNHPRLHLCLSHLTRAPFTLNDEYVRYFRERRHAGDYIIMDNGADESRQGKGDSLFQILEAARLVGAQEIVLPDVQMSASGTVHNTREALYTLETYDGRQHYDAVGRPRVMIVPQGTNVLEWVECAKTLLHKARHTMRMIDGPSIVVGVAKQYHEMFKTQKEGGRTRLVRWLYEKLGEHEEIHLLGYPRGAHDAPAIDKKWPGFIRSVDSAKPVVYAMNGIVPTREHMPTYPKRPQGYFLKGMDQFERGYLEANIQFFCYA